MATSSSSSSSSSTVSRSITLSEKQNKEYVLGRSQGYRLTLEVTEANNVASEVFVFFRSPAAAAGEAPIDEFSDVASTFDIAHYDVGQPAEGERYYRLDAVSLVFRNLELLEQTLSAITADIQVLIRTLNQLDALTDTSQPQELSAST